METSIRVVDVLASILGLLILSPLLITVVVILTLTGEKKIFFLQPRVGNNGKIFNLIKFATMLSNSDQCGTKELTLPNDERVLKFGKILRKTKLNELPQLINVIKGDLSLIGPRPQTVRYFKYFKYDDATLIASVKPGVSGLASVLFRDEEKLFVNVNDPLKFDAEVVTPYKGQIERWFVENRSLSLYLKLIGMTILAVLFNYQFNYWEIFKDLPSPPRSLSIAYK